jgi:hypothetical protein
VIPTLILAGFVVGRWWIVPVAMAAWPALLIGTGVGDPGLHLIVGGSLIAMPNVALGVLCGGSPGVFGIGLAAPILTEPGVTTPPDVAGDETSPR